MLVQEYGTKRNTWTFKIPISSQRKRTISSLAVFLRLLGLYKYSKCFCMTPTRSYHCFPPPAATVFALQIRLLDLSVASLGPRARPAPEMTGASWMLNRSDGCISILQRHAAYRPPSRTPVLLCFLGFKRQRRGQGLKHLAALQVNMPQLRTSPSLGPISICSLFGCRTPQLAAK